MTAVHEGLTNEELAVLAKKNDKKAIERLIAQNEGFVIFMASSFLKRYGFHDRYKTGLIEDYAQICRMAIMKAVKNYDKKNRAKFITYAGRIMWNAMLDQMEKDSDYREHVVDVLQEEDDTSDEECDEEYGDSYDNKYENRNAVDWNIMPSTRYYGLKETIAVETFSFDDEEFKAAGVSRLSGYIRTIAEADKQGKTASKKKKEDKIQYKSCKESNFSWKYPIYHKALKDMQIKTMLQSLLDKDFNDTQREYLIYRYGLKNLNPQTQKEAAEHFYLSTSYAKKIEKDGLDELKEKLMEKHLL